ncbi:uncharacterized protein Z519_07993 [Cladophialophora bantiana CBS 173.52]|uniref:Uncharacterized protein n=1 Tax=Cladophialophora bantiana (strain ATCC 10958 / CBS 173.52 / CDC B-1940 / NIH 8579) TaxID=1442370 RepID=A0A0D2I2K8_CLAB1|nr:uncharacterized protein Z519_07993 [Cladophialophora bantiana CBS 173.52]KIW91099.1 hypothetical protein Z519_07993 [Cladophialophora bantiana CBS 173.52]
MAPWLQLAALPSSLLVLIASLTPPASCQHLNLRWPYNLPADSKYYPEDELMVKRDMDVQRKLQRSMPTAVRKMSGDPGEKFYLEYWGFEEQDEEFNNYSSDWTNATFFTSFEQPLRLHGSHQSPRLFRRLLPGWHLFSERDFQCPTGTSACTSIDRPNSCCATGYTCQLVQDTGLGDVGCCPDGQVCGNALATSYLDRDDSDESNTINDDCDELYDGNTFALDALDNDSHLHDYDHPSTDPDFECHTPATSHFHRHAHSHSDLRHDPPTHVLLWIPILPGLTGRRVLPNGSPMRLCKLSSAVHVILGDTRTTRASDFSYDDRRDDNHDHDPLHVAIVPGHRVSHWLLRLLGLLRRRMLPDRPKLRLDILSRSAFHDAGLREHPDHCRADRSGNHCAGNTGNGELCQGLDDLRPKCGWRVLSQRLCLRRD